MGPKQGREDNKLGEEQRMKKLDEEQSKRYQKSQEALNSIIEELRRGFNLDIPKELRRI